ncbi:MAG TPA: hypothetical protein VNZ06_05060 [Steroidobacteraceae bacterium]|nr:hypothetical protein [Steroidobacteraceae bacterium]
MADRSGSALEVGDCVTFERSMIPAIGTVAELLDDDYVKVRWHDMSIATTHRQLALIKLEALVP